MEGRGFSFVEILSACPSGWKVTPREAIHWVEKNMIPIFPLGVFKDRDTIPAAHPSPQRERVGAKPAASP
jgi:pyruvate/2-oxoacid:ferredoxin oxidoreductase beta subunit